MGTFEWPTGVVHADIMSAAENMIHVFILPIALSTALETLHLASATDKFRN